MSDLTFRNANRDLRLESLREMLAGLLPDGVADLIDDVEANPNQGEFLITGERLPGDGLVNQAADDESRNEQDSPDSLGLILTK